MGIELVIAAELDALIGDKVDDETFARLIQEEAARWRMEDAAASF